MIALTFDTDWMEQEDLQRFLDEYAFPGVGTFFLHRGYTLEGLRRHERCPHPPPLAGNAEQWKATVGQMLHDLKLTPTGIRTHTALHSHVLELSVGEMGFKYTSNSSRLFLNHTEPVRLGYGCWEMPIYYMDSLDLAMPKYWPTLRHEVFSHAALMQALAGDGLYVFDFHPLHVCLNSPSLDYYQHYKARLQAGESPFALAFRGKGAGSYFRELCQLMTACKIHSTCLIDALEKFAPRAEVPITRAA